jgi:hypothetical protein
VRVAFSPDGLRVAALERDVRPQGGAAPVRARIRRLADLRIEAALATDAAPTTVAFSRDGGLVAVSTLRTVHVFAGTGDVERTRITVPEQVSAVDFSEDGRYVVVMGRRYLQRYLWNVADLQAEVCRRVTRNLTLEEWTKYVPEGSYTCACPRALPCPAPSR